MITKREQVEFVTSVKIGENERKSINCPFCGGVKKFTLSNQEGKLLWNCFKASCNAKGAHRIGHSLESIKSGDYKKVIRRINSRPIPTILGDPKNYQKCLDYLEQNNCLYAYENNLCRISYDPQEIRILFHINNQGAVGRSLTKRIPKWLTYGDVASPLFVGKSSTCVIVEDSASACSVASTGVYTGCAILGTNVSRGQMSQLKQYEKHIICLDKDASKKALSLYQSLNLPSVSIRFLEHDFKYQQKGEILKVLHA